MHKNRWVGVLVVGMILMSVSVRGQNTTFEFKGDKSPLYYTMKPTDGKDGFEAKFVFEYCFVNCGAWKTPILYFNRLGKPQTLGYYRSGKYYSANTTDATLRKLILDANYESNIYMDVNTEIVVSRARQAIYNCVNVQQNNSPNIGCFDGNTFVWFDEKNNENNRSKVRLYACSILGYKLSYSFLEGPCKKLNEYIDNVSKNARKESLKKELNALPESELEKRLNIRRQLTAIDPEDAENNMNISIIEKKMAAKIEDAKNNQKREEQKYISDFKSEANKVNASTNTISTYQPQKTTDQIIGEGANQITSIILNARKRNEAYEEELKRKKQEAIERAEQRTEDLKIQKRTNMARLQARANENPADFNAWLRANNTNSMEAYADYLNKFGDNAVFVDPARVFYRGFRAKQSQAELDQEIRWAVGWDNWSLVLYLVSLGANPNVEWYLADGTYDGNIISKLDGSDIRNEYTDFPVNTRERQMEILAYLLKKGLDLNQGNFLYEYRRRYRPSSDIHFSVLNAICTSNNLGKSKSLNLFDEALSLLSEHAIDDYFETKSGDLWSFKKDEIRKNGFKNQEINEYSAFAKKYLDTMYKYLNIDMNNLISLSDPRASKEYQNFFAGLFSSSNHLIVLNYLKEKGLDGKMINSCPDCLKQIHYCIAYPSFPEGHPTAKEIEIMKVYFDLGVSPETKTDFNPYHKSVYKFWKKNNPMCAEIWDDYKKAHHIK